MSEKADLTDCNGLFILLIYIALSTACHLLIEFLMKSFTLIFSTSSFSTAAWLMSNLGIKGLLPLVPAGTLLRGDFNDVTEACDFCEDWLSLASFPRMSLLS